MSWCWSEPSFWLSTVVLTSYLTTLSKCNLHAIKFIRVYNSLIFNKFTKLHNHHYSTVLEHFRIDPSWWPFHVHWKRMCFLLPLWDARACHKLCIHCPQRELASAAATRPMSSIPGAHKDRHTCTACIKGIRSITCWEKRQQATQLKAGPWFCTRWKSKRTWALLCTWKQQYHN